MGFNDTLAMPSSYYVATANSWTESPALVGEHRVDLVVVGGGCTGLSAALHAARQGLSVVLLEGGKIGWGASGRNGGQIIPGLRKGAADLVKTLGIERARALLGLAFEARDLVRAARMLADAGERELMRTFVLAADDTLPSSEEYVLLYDLAKQYGDTDLAMRVGRAGAQRGFILFERAYPVLMPPTGPDLPEPAFSLAIMRQESNFDPGQRSGPGARGLMQVMPSTASAIARRIGVGYSAARLNEPEYNMKLGTAVLQQMTNEQGGSYALTAASYNAGPGRAAQWVGACGDPRGGTTDPTDFIECISISETRNYVMRILETTQVYRARLNGGTAPLQLTADLKRGGWTPGSSPSGPGPQPYTASPSPYFQNGGAAATSSPSRR